ncbi:MAG TPA: SMR family transporter [Bordetella sp.]|nr:SMR family transporter [Bordetella sp.]
MPYFFLVLASACGVAASVALKVGGASGFMRQAGLAACAPYGLAVVAYGGGFVFYALALRQLDLTLAYPLMVALSMAGLLAYGVLVGHEPVGALRAAGALLIGAGIFLVSR